MTLSLSYIMQMMGRTFRDPASVASEVKALNLNAKTGWMIYALGAVLSLILSEIGELIIPPTIEFPFWWSILVFATFTYAWVYVSHTIAKALGGQGSFSEHLGALAWLQLWGALITGLSIIVMAIVPSIALAATLVFAAFQIRANLVFLKITHNYLSLWKAFGAYLSAAFVMGILIYILIQIFGLPEGLVQQLESLNVQPQ